MKSRWFIGIGMMVAIFLGIGALRVQSQADKPTGVTGAQTSIDTVFTYQGYLDDNGTAASGNYDFEFALYTTETIGTGTQVGGTNPVPDLLLADGVFTTQLDFGSTAFTGEAQYLEIRVRPGANTGSYETLDPRQRLTAVPYAHGLIPGATVSGNVTSGMLTLNNATGDGLDIPTAGGHGVYVGHVGGDGMYIANAGRHGVDIFNATSDGVLVWDAGGNGFNAVRPSLNGVSISSAGNNGVHVASSTVDGIQVHNTGDDGIDINHPGGNGVEITAAGKNGVRVGTTVNHGVYIGNPNLNGVHIASSGVDGIQVHNTGDDGIDINHPGGNGVEITAAGENGVRVGTTVNHGVVVLNAGDDGVHVEKVGNPTNIACQAGNNGVEVCGTDGYGLYVGWSNADGVRVESAGHYGIYAKTTSASHYGGYFINNANGGAALFASAGDNNTPDLILGGNDDGIIASNPANSGSDLFLKANDAVVVVLNDDQTSGEDSDFEIFSGNNVIFNVDEGGITTVEVLKIDGGADIAEGFDINANDKQTPEPGMVVCIDTENPGALVVCSNAYDFTVAGAVSGAGGVNPGMVMGQDGSIAAGEYPVALTGRIYVMVDASYGAIQPGDLLTTSNTPGHAMKVTDYDQAQGAILGKAMTSLDSSTGLVLVLVTLQ